MSETLPLDQLLEKTDSLYEAVVIIAQRARQINEQQKRIIDRHVNADEEEDLDETLNTDIVEGQYLKLPKPTSVAMKEMMDGHLDYEYVEKD